MEGYLELLFIGETPLFDVVLETADEVLSGMDTSAFFTGVVGGLGVGHATSKILTE
jgi:hypothetical protein